MDRHLEFNQITASNNALKQYMRIKRGNEKEHKATVIISSHGKMVYHGILPVFPVIATNTSFVEILGDDSFTRDFYSRYSTDYHVFNYINGTLLIKGKDIWSNPVEIDITSI